MFKINYFLKIEVFLIELLGIITKFTSYFLISVHMRHYIKTLHSNQTKELIKI